MRPTEREISAYGLVTVYQFSFSLLKRTIFIAQSGRFVLKKLLSFAYSVYRAEFPPLLAKVFVFIVCPRADRARRSVK